MEDDKQGSLKWIKRGLQTFGLVSALSTSHPAIAQEVNTPASPKPKIESGFNTHVYADQTEKLNLDQFEKTVDELVENGQNIVRFDLPNWEILPSTPEQIVWNDSSFKVYDQAIEYANQKGLDIFLATSLPTFAKNFSDQDYEKFTQNYYHFLASRYKGQVDIWQITNEPDVHNFTDYSEISDLTPEYLEKLASVVKIASQQIKLDDPEAKVTVNVVGSLNSKTAARWEKILTAVSPYIDPYIDLITLDLYPDDNQTEISGLEERVNRLFEKFG